MESPIDINDFVTHYYIHVHSETGDVVGMSASSSETESQVDGVELITVGPEEYAAMRYRRCYFDRGVFIDTPHAPSIYHDWNPAKKEWEKNQARVDEFMPADVRAQRDRLLAASDWTDTASAPSRIGQEVWQAWHDYRQALRDVTDQPGFPEEVVWPTAPDAQKA